MSLNGKRSFATPVLALMLALSTFPFAANGRAATRRDFPERLQYSEHLAALAGQDSAVPKEARAAHWRKVGSPIRQTLAAMARDRVDEFTAARADLTRYSSAVCPIGVDGSLGATIRLTRLDDEARAALSALDVAIDFENPNDVSVEAHLPFYRVEAAAKLDCVNTIAPLLGFTTNTGSVNSQGDAIMLANQARQNFGVTGRNVKVGVISDSVDGIQQSQASGDLPSNVQVLKFGEGAGEGTAMLEIVNDLAPGANLAFYGPTTSADMSAGITALANAGCDVIVDDLTFFDQPTFEEGQIAQTINNVVANGVVYCTSAGNDANNHFQGDFTGIGSLGGPTRNVHGFPNQSGAQRFIAAPQSSTRILMQWADRFGSAGDDYDLYVITQNGSIVAKSDDTQDGNDLPMEVVQVTNTSSSPQTFFVIVDLFSGQPKRFDLLYSRSILDLDFKSGTSSIGHNQNAARAITVAAINASDPGHDTLADYSSQGPVDIFFPSFERRNKPEITAIDGVSVTGAAGFPSPFFGTSAATPHAAAVAALMLEADPGLTPDAVLVTMQRSAFDYGPAGYDFAYGAGLVSALTAVRGFPYIGQVGISGKNLVVVGSHFAPGATMFVNGAPKKTKADRNNPTTILLSKKALKAIPVGSSAQLQVRNPDGTTSLDVAVSR